MIELRLPRQLYQSVRTDLARPHRFAGERVGFLFGKLAHAGGGLLVLLYRYVPAADGHYVRSRNYAACIGGEAIRAVRNDLRARDGTREGAFHVHTHEQQGEPHFSWPDLQGLPPLIPSFQQPAKDGAHGLLLLSEDHGIAWVWPPGAQEHVTASRVVVVGAPLSIFEADNHGA